MNTNNEQYNFQTLVPIDNVDDLYVLVDKKVKIIEQQKVEFRPKIEIAQKEIQVIRDEQLRNEIELDALYLLPPTNRYLSVNGQREDQFANRIA